MHARFPGGVRAEASKGSFGRSHGKHFSFRKGRGSLSCELLYLTQTISGLRNPGRPHWNSLRCYCWRCRWCSHCRSCWRCCNKGNAPTTKQWNTGVYKEPRDKVLQKCTHRFYLPFLVTLENIL
nr:MAG TPA: hypothetical protein [Caudoviricetes sp.]